MKLKEMLERFDDSRQELNKKLEQVFPKGKVVTFKHGNMREYQEATVDGACVSLGHPQVCLINNRTGNRRWISLNNIPKVWAFIF